MFVANVAVVADAVLVAFVLRFFEGNYVKQPLYHLYHLYHLYRFYQMYQMHHLHQL